MTKRKKGKPTKYCRFYPACRDSPTHRVRYHIQGENANARKSYYCQNHSGQLEDMIGSGRGQEIVQLFGFHVDNVERL